MTKPRKKSRKPAAPKCAPIEHSHEDWKRAMKAALKEESKIEHTKD